MTLSYFSAIIFTVLCYSLCFPLLLLPGLVFLPSVLLKCNFALPRYSILSFSVLYLLILFFHSKTYLLENSSKNWFSGLLSRIYILFFIFVLLFVCVFDNKVLLEL